VFTKQHIRIEDCKNGSELLRKARRWSKIHGPRTRVYVSTPECAVFLYWGKDIPHIKDRVSVGEWLFAHFT
jgi:hypothetical protein